MDLLGDHMEVVSCQVLARQEREYASALAWEEEVEGHMHLKSSSGMLQQLQLSVAGPQQVRADWS